MLVTPTDECIAITLAWSLSRAAKGSHSVHILLCVILLNVHISVENRVMNTLMGKLSCL